MPDLLRVLFKTLCTTEMLSFMYRAVQVTRIYIFAGDGDRASLQRRGSHRSVYFTLKATGNFK